MHLKIKKEHNVYFGKVIERFLCTIGILRQIVAADSNDKDARNPLLGAFAIS